MSESALDRSALDKHPLPPVIDGGKESKGRILIVAGSRGVPGAALLAATAAMRAGAGKLRIATVESAAMTLAVAMPEAMVVGLPEGDDGGFAGGAVERIEELARDVDAVVAGPGVKRSQVCKRLANVLLESQAALALDVAFLETLEPLHERALDRISLPILLPNADELASLLECEPKHVDEDPIGCGMRAAELYRSVVLVKGVTSHLVTPARECWTYEGGAPGLGVSGSGDVLAGIVGGLLARGAEPLNALLWSVWLHGEAGARVAEKIGPVGFLAREIAGEVPGLLPR
ncbi:MAG TPA: NAD(P)H-hydrate dehydratase [Sphingomicrobium sp.]|nr:NAD(P)H-hydrate dehydratase [Sphingomicrobium sp.]